MTTTTTITFFYDRSDPKNAGWAYHVTTHTTGRDDGITVDIDHDETSGPVDVRRIDAGLTTLRRAFFRAIDPASPTGLLRRAFARADWTHGPHGDRLTHRAIVVSSPSTR